MRGSKERSSPLAFRLQEQRKLKVKILTEALREFFEDLKTCAQMDDEIRSCFR